MGEYYLGQIVMAGFSFAPKGFALCNGQLLAVATNQALFSLLGTQYGGDGRTTFGLPDLRGRVPVSTGASVDASWQPTPLQAGDRGGGESVTLLPTQMPAHSHQVLGVNAPGTVRIPTGCAYAGTGTGPTLYAAPGNKLVAQAPSSVGPAGSTQPHPNMQPFAVINFFICAQAGIYPPRS